MASCHAGPSYWSPAAGGSGLHSARLSWAIVQEGDQVVLFAMDSSTENLPPEKVGSRTPVLSSMPRRGCDALLSEIVARRLLHFLPGARRDACRSVFRVRRIGVTFHRGELGKPEELESRGMHLCHACRYDLRKTKMSSPPCIDGAADDFLKSLVLSLKTPEAPVSISDFDILHQFAKLLLSDELGQHLNAFVSERLSLRSHFPEESPDGYETGSLTLRHESIAMAVWLFLDLESRLTEAWEQGAVRYNLLMKDFKDPPTFYTRLVEKFNRRQPMKYNRTK